MHDKHTHTCRSSAVIDRHPLQHTWYNHHTSCSKGCGSALHPASRLTRIPNNLRDACTVTCTNQVVSAVGNQPPRFPGTSLKPAAARAERARVYTEWRYVYVTRAPPFIPYSCEAVSVLRPHRPHHNNQAEPRSVSHTSVSAPTCSLSGLRLRGLPLSARA